MSASSRKIRVGLVGFGNSGQVFHAPFLHTMSNMYELRSVVERHSNEAVKIYPYIKTVRSTTELFDDPDIDLVIIGTLYRRIDRFLPLVIDALGCGRLGVRAGAEDCNEHGCCQKLFH